MRGFILLLSFTILGYSTFSQPITFEKKYNIGTAIGDLIKTDNGYLFAGTNGVNIGDVRKLAGEIDSAGNLLWYKEYMKGRTGYIIQTVQLNNYFYSIGADHVQGSDWEVSLFVINSSGDSIRNVQIGGPDMEEAHALALTSDSNLIAVGYTTSFGAGGSDVYIVKLDTLGDTIWTKTWGGPLIDVAHRIVKFNDSIFYIAGDTENFNTSGSRDIFLLKMNIKGDILWYKTYGGLFGEWLNDITISDENIYLAGSQEHSTQTYFTKYILKLDTAGMILDSLVGKTQVSHIPFGIVIKDKSIYLTGSKVGQLADLFIEKYTTNFDSLWHRTYGGSKSDHGYVIKYTDDDGLLIGGTSDSDCNGCIYFIKTDSMGCVVPGCYLSIDDPVGDTETISIYPNPFHDHLNIYLATHQIEATVFIMDIMGRNIIQQPLKSTRNIINTSELSDGIYIIQVQLKDGSLINNKLIKK